MHRYTVQIIQLILFIGLLFPVIECLSQDSLLLEPIKFVIVENSSLNHDCFSEPDIFRSNAEINSQSFTKCFQLKDEFDLKKHDLLIWYVPWTEFKCKVSLQIWQIRSHNTYIIEAVREQTDRRNLNAVESVQTYLIPKIPMGAEVDFVITDI